MSMALRFVESGVLIVFAVFDCNIVVVCVGVIRSCLTAYGLPSAFCYVLVCFVQVLCFVYGDSIAIQSNTNNS